jgi:hypothetical protein
MLLCFCFAFFSLMASLGVKYIKGMSRPPIPVAPPPEMPGLVTTEGGEGPLLVGVWFAEML